MSEQPQTESDDTCACGCGAPARNGKPLADHPHTDPGDGSKECLTCGKWVHLVLHSCKRVPVTATAMDRFRAARQANFPPAQQPPTTDGADR